MNLVMRCVFLLSRSLYTDNSQTRCDGNAQTDVAVRHQEVCFPFVTGSIENKCLKSTVAAYASNVQLWLRDGTAREDCHIVQLTWTSNTSCVSN